MNNPEEILTECEISLTYDNGTFKNRPVRFLSDIGVFQVGDDNFDRWGNSVELEFDLWTPKGQRAFLRWVKS